MIIFYIQIRLKGQPYEGTEQAVACYEMEISSKFIYKQ